MDEKQYRLRNLKKCEELCIKGIHSDVDKLKYVMYSITPYSTYWRMGVVRALQHAIRLLEDEQNGN